MGKAQKYRLFSGDHLGEISAFSTKEAPVPSPGPGEILLTVEATGLGFVDLLLMQGKYQVPPDLPFVPGGEIAGTIAAVGALVDGLVVGDRVALWQTGGGAAEKLLTSAERAVAIPDGLAAIDAASMLLDFLTAQYALYDRGALSARDTVLVLGAAGGVGSAAVQLAARSGARVIAAASNDAKRQYARRLGAAEVVDSSRPDWRKELKAMTTQSGLDLVVDPVGGALFEPAFRSLSKGGRHLVIGFASGNIPALPANLALLKSASLIGVDVRHFMESTPVAACAVLKNLMDAAARSPFDTLERKVFSLSDASSAFSALGDRSRIGKIVLVP